jgi:DNA-binding GntR family transcriptional regulator
MAKISMTGTRTLNLSPLRSEGLCPEIAQVLRDAIFKGTLRPGDPIPETLVAEQLRVSRSPIREALMVLENEGLVEMKARRTSFVRTMTEREIFEIVSIRFPLEALAIDLARGRISVDAIQGMKNQLEVMRRLAQEGEVRELLAAEFAFHKLIWAASGNALLEETLTRICTPWFAFAQATFQESSINMNPPASADAHQLLVDYLESKTSLSAVQCYQRHLSGLNPQVYAALRQFSQLMDSASSDYPRSAAEQTCVSTKDSES